jgi:hypothetical protein
VNVGISVSRVGSAPRRPRRSRRSPADQARARAVPRNGGVRAVRLRPRRSDPQAARARSARDRADEAAAVLAAGLQGMRSSAGSRAKSWARHAPRRKPQLEELIGTVKVMLDAYRRTARSIACSWYTTLRQHHDAEADHRRSCCRWWRDRQPSDAGASCRSTLGLHLRAGRAGRARGTAHALHRVAGVPGRGRERGVRAWPRAWSP